MLGSKQTDGRQRSWADARWSRRSPSRIWSLPLVAVLLLPTSARAATDPTKDGLLLALETELKRSYEGLRQVEGPALYYLGYEARDTRSYALNAELGAIVYETERRNRSLDVDARVGSRKLDNTHQLKGRGGGLDFPRTKYRRISIDDDEAALRADIWRRTDQVYKDAVNRYTTVETNKAVIISPAAREAR